MSTTAPPGLSASKACLAAPSGSIISWKQSKRKTPVADPLRRANPGSSSLSRSQLQIQDGRRERTSCTIRIRAPCVPTPPTFRATLGSPHSSKHTPRCPALPWSSAPWHSRSMEHDNPRPRPWHSCTAWPGRGCSLHSRIRRPE